MATESFLCTDCGITFTAKKNLTRHIVLVHAKTQVTCEKCGKHFTREDNLKRHLVRCNPKNSDTLTCEKCQKKFSSKSNLNKHMKTHATPLLWMKELIMSWMSWRSSSSVSRTRQKNIFLWSNHIRIAKKLIRTSQRQGIHSPSSLRENCNVICMTISKLK